MKVRREGHPPGLYQFRTRYLDPRAGRLMSRDSLGIWADPLSFGNGYTYAGNNPANFRDPLGYGVKGTLRAIGSFFTSYNPSALADDIDSFVSVVGTYTEDWVDRNTDGSWGGILANAAVTTAFDMLEGSADVLRLGDDIGMVIGEGNADTHDILMASSQEIGRVSEIILFVAGPAKGTSTLRSVGTKGDNVGTGLRRTSDSLENIFCFPAGTLVLMADGSTRPIELVEPGDVVLSMEPEMQTGAVASEVVATPTSRARKLKVLYLDTDGDGSTDASLAVTAEHTFWTGNRGWRDADELLPGDRLLGRDGEVSAVMVCSEWDAVPTHTFNLSIADTQAFFVVVDGVSVLVHNTPKIKIDGIHEDWVVKGPHLKVDGIEFKITGGSGPEGRGFLKLEPVFSKDKKPKSRKEVKKAREAVLDAIAEDPKVRQKILDQVRKATNKLGQEEFGKLTRLARDRSGATRALEFALERWCR